MEQFLHFLLTYQDQVFLAMFATLALVALVNFVHNAYARQNFALKRFNKKTLHSPSSIVWETRQLPMDYQRQWRAFVNSGCAKPSVVFEFAKRPQRYLLWFAHFVAFVVCVAYFVLAIALDDQEIFATQIAFALASALVVLLTKLIGLINLSHARKVFGKFLRDLNTVVDIVKTDKSCIQQPTTFVEKCGVPNAQSADNPTQTPPQSATEIPPQTDKLSVTQPADATPTLEQQICKNRGNVVEKAVQILQQNGLDSPRTIEEQRKLNIALNNLLQACCKK